ncbi:hypothetical protein BLNAU_15345 [Blattamonas nauphoetae]|uniref:Uncharacterized protein n=1 Tax=Blattamonas nauphoetae TaxID=2049346 RepID=A0ABQ9XCV4_9EUKA|nr:hypothetical protein BLNAU_15345 [Blattamonas nauphoetae]
MFTRGCVRAVLMPTIRLPSQPSVFPPNHPSSLPTIRLPSQPSVFPPNHPSSLPTIRLHCPYRRPCCSLTEDTKSSVQVPTDLPTPTSNNPTTILQLYLHPHPVPLQFPRLPNKSGNSWTHRSDICVVGTVVEKKLSTIGEIDINTLQPSLHELDDMVEAERMKKNDDPMQGLGMNDGDKGGGTAGAQAKLETSKMILLTVPNLLDQPSYSVDQLHRLALLAARKAKETFEYIKKQLLISPNSVALWKMM